MVTHNSKSDLPLVGCLFLTYLDKKHFFCNIRYHFCGTRGIFFERTPYRNHRFMTQTQRHVTRFISLARVGNKEKNKWIYAFNIVPLKCLNKSDLVAQPNVVTDMPYNESHMKVCT